MRIVWAISRYYGSDERMAALLQRIAHAILERCKEAVRVEVGQHSRAWPPSCTEAALGFSAAHSNIDSMQTLHARAQAVSVIRSQDRKPRRAPAQELFDLPANEATEVLHHAVAALTRWQAAYLEMRAAIEESGRDARWEFSKTALFSSTNYMAEVR